MRTAPPKNKRPQKDDSEPKPPRYAPPRPRPLRFVGGVIQGLTGAALLVGLLLGLGMWRGGDRFVEGLRLMVMPPPPEPEVDVRTVIVQQIRGANELTTAIFAMEAVVPTKSDRTLAGYTIGSTSLLYIAYGEVRAGVDLNQITPDDVQVEESGVRITLPPPKILDQKLDLERSNVDGYDRGFLGLGPDNAPELQVLAQEAALRKIVVAACHQGILQEAQDRAELSVSQLLSTAGFETVEVVSQPVAEPLCSNVQNGDTVN